MFKTNNKRIVQGGTILSFTAPRTGHRFAFVVHFVADRDEHGRIVKGVRFAALNGSLFPEGARLNGAFGEPFRPGDGYILPKASNSCALTDTDGSSYELFKVQLVDQGEDDTVYGKVAGGVLYFHATAAIPTELGGEGELRDDPTGNLEGFSG